MGVDQGNLQVVDLDVILANCPITITLDIFTLLMLHRLYACLHKCTPVSEACLKKMLLFRGLSHL